MKYVAFVAFSLVLVAGALTAQEPHDTPDVLALKAQVQVLREQVKAITLGAAQCDLAWADTRAQLAALQLTLRSAEVQDGRAQLEARAKAAGFTIEWPDATNKLDSPVVKSLPRQTVAGP